MPICFLSSFKQAAEILETAPMTGMQFSALLPASAVTSLTVTDSSETCMGALSCSREEFALECYTAGHPFRTAATIVQLHSAGNSFCLCLACKVLLLPLVKAHWICFCPPAPLQVRSSGQTVSSLVQEWSPPLSAWAAAGQHPSLSYLFPVRAPAGTENLWKATLNT